MSHTQEKKESVPASEYLSCEHCLAFFQRLSLWRHGKSCPFRKSNSTKICHIQSHSSLLLPTSYEITNGMNEKILGRMMFDDITMAACTNSLIMKLGGKLYLKHLPQFYNYISQKMRELGRFLIIARTINSSIKTLTDVIDLAKFPVAIQTTRLLCRYKADSNRYETPSVALKIGHSLQRLVIHSRDWSFTPEILSTDEVKGTNFRQFYNSGKSRFISYYMCTSMG